MQRTLNGFLPNGTIINGVANFYTAIKPTTRIDGSALQLRDRWYNIFDGASWFWNGTYWLSNPYYYTFIDRPGNGRTATIAVDTVFETGVDSAPIGRHVLFPLVAGYTSVLLSGVRVALQGTNNLSVSNSFELQILNATDILVCSVGILDAPLKSFALNNLITMDFYFLLRVFAPVVGSPSFTNVRSTFTFTYHIVSP